VVSSTGSARAATSSGQRTARRNVQPVARLRAKQRTERDGHHHGDAERLSEELVGVGTYCPPKHEWRDDRGENSAAANKVKRDVGQLVGDVAT